MDKGTGNAGRRARKKKRAKKNTCGAGLPSVDAEPVEATGRSERSMPLLIDQPLRSLEAEKKKKTKRSRSDCESNRGREKRGRGNTREKIHSRNPKG